MVEPPANQPEIEPLTRTQVLIFMGVTAVVLLLAAKLWLHFDSVALLPVRWLAIDLVWGVMVGGLITAASALVYRLWPAYRRSADFYVRLVVEPLIWPDLIWLGLLPGLSEELLFRGVMLPALGMSWAGLLVSSICFGILHFSGWPYVIWATVVGLLLGYSALATGNLLVPIVAHIVTNLVGSIMWKLGNRDSQQPLT
ncbi:hypothetical protein AVDCRST_MAG94-3340 [uncultured Leptolyngbya sp.]|uniref:CAAX prenyl protease 2/Lysostaphin resistance protein A-like domain-containing protein n=1 Tax=uncultured Leptolyngbya sp. TaxID=332963 RepID=A0A6J4MNZ6_9CYAN|nr:hypothetical protein AVDCRST_MAG94-3340 [uncultured Leptolyngbya sp.]